MSLNIHLQDASGVSQGSEPMKQSIEQSSEGRSTQTVPSFWDSLNITEVKSASAAREEVDPQQILRELQPIFRLALFERFEVGMESEFITALTASVTKYGTRAIVAIAHIILTDQAKPQIAAEALRWFGELQHRESQLFRLKVLEVSLRHPSRWVRDAAALGLDSMADPHAIPALRAAVNCERFPELRKDLLSVLSQLQQL